jgi:hypothetical protein
VFVHIERIRHHILRWCPEPVNDVAIYRHNRPIKIAHFGLRLKSLDRSKRVGTRWTLLNFGVAPLRNFSAKVSTFSHSRPWNERYRR